MDAAKKSFHIFAWCEHGLTSYRNRELQMERYLSPAKAVLSALQINSDNILGTSSVLSMVQ